MSEELVGQIRNGANQIGNFANMLSEKSKTIETLEKNSSHQLEVFREIARNTADLGRARTIGEDSEDFYECLLNTRRTAAVRQNGVGEILLTDFTVKVSQVSSQTPEQESSKERQFYDSIINFCTEYPKVHVKRIVTFHDVTKIEEYQKIIDQAKKIPEKTPLENLHIAYLHIGNLDSDAVLPYSVLPYTIGVQVFPSINNDAGQMILMDPRTARLRFAQYSQYPPIVLSGCTPIVNAFKDYWRDLWQKIESSDIKGLGCILYDGDKRNPDLTSQETWEIIHNQMDDVTTTIDPSDLREILDRRKTPDDSSSKQNVFES